MEESVNQESKGKQPSFAEKLGQIWTKLAENHPTPDSKCMAFVASDADGRINGTWSCTPREYAQAIVDQTSFGLSRIQFYLEISKGLGDETGQRVLNDLSEDIKF